MSSIAVEDSPPGDTNATSSESKAPSQIFVHLALLFGQMINGGSSVVAACGLPAVNPMFFALLREVCATPILGIIARVVDGPPRVTVADLRRCLWASLALLFAQIGFVTGIKLTNPVIGSAWQPSQPVFVLVIAVALRLEACSVLKTIGVLVCLLGDVIMTVADARSGGSDESDTDVEGNVVLFLNCLATAVFIVVMRGVVTQIPAVTAIAIVYAITSVGILISALLISNSPELSTFFCPECTQGFWYFPLEAGFALAYWALGNSVMAYLVLSFGAKHARDATHCLAYTAIQPVTAGLLESLLVIAGWNKTHPGNPLKLPSAAQAGGAILVLLGVACVACDARQGSAGEVHLARGEQRRCCTQAPESEAAPLAESYGVRVET